MRTSACFCSSLMVWSARMARVRSGEPDGGLEDAGLHVEGLGGDAQRLGDLLEDLGRGPAQPALDLAQVRVGDAGQLGEPAQREPGRAPLLTDEGPEVEPAVFRVRAHSCKRTAGQRVAAGDVRAASPPERAARPRVAWRLDPGWDRGPFGYGPARSSTHDRPRLRRSAMAEYTLPDLPYDYAALEPYVSAQIMELHHDKHHAAYVAGANQTLEKLAAARDKDDFGAIVGLEKTLAFHISGHVLHSIFWKNQSPDGGDKPDGALGLGHRRELRLLRQVQGAVHPGDLDDPGLGLGCAGLRASRRPAHRRAGLRPPEQRRPGLRPAPRLRRLGARLLPAVQEREGRLLRRAVERRQLARRGGPPRRGQGARRSPADGLAAPPSEA